MRLNSILAIETSTEQLSLAIIVGDRLFLREIDAGQRHSELALPLMYELLAEAGVTLQDLDAFAFGQGPGSFTGVRIACGLTQGLALGSGKPVIAVETQMALAEQAGGDRVVVALDARMGEIYLAAYQRQRDAGNGCGWQPAIAPMLVKPDALPALDGQSWRGIGSAFDVPLLATSLSARYGAQIERIVPGALPSAAAVVAIASRRVERLGMAGTVPAEHAAPLYLRNHVAMTIVERQAIKAEREEERVKAAAK